MSMPAIVDNLGPVGSPTRAERASARRRWVPTPSCALRILWMHLIGCASTTNPHSHSPDKRVDTKLETSLVESMSKVGTACSPSDVLQPPRPGNKTPDDVVPTDIVLILSKSHDCTSGRVESILYQFPATDELVVHSTLVSACGYPDEQLLNWRWSCRGRQLRLTTWESREGNDQIWVGIQEEVVLPP
jgi:hypothetical protein